MTVRIINADVMAGLATLPDNSVHCVVTSPPYWGLRDYGVEGQIGAEKTLEVHIDKLVCVFREVRRVLCPDGTLWLNYGDSYASRGGAGWQGKNGQRANREFTAPNLRGNSTCASTGIKAKDLIGAPWMLAFALRASGWWLRQEIIWYKPNPTPESCRDRCTKAHEHIFLFTKSERYYYDQDAIRENDNEAAPLGAASKRVKVPGNYDCGEGAHGTIHRSGRTSAKYQEAELKPGRNRHSVWRIATEAFPEAHFATFPQALAEICIRAGCPAGGTVLDPFGGAGTAGLVADKLKRNAVLIELNSDYAHMAKRRISDDAGMFAAVELETLQSSR